MPIFNLFGIRKIASGVMHMHKANVYLEEGNFDAAIQEMKMAIDIYPIKENNINNKLTLDDRDFFICAHYNLGAAYARKARTLKATDPKYKELFELALIEYEKILNYDPNDAEAHNNIGACKNALGDLESAIKSRKESLDNNPAYPESYVELGKGLCKQKKYDEAIQAFTNAINIRNDYAEAYYFRASAYSETRRIQDAIDDYNNAIKYKHDFYQAYHDCGLLYSQQGNNKKAIKYFIDALVYTADDNKDGLALTHNCFAVSLARIEKKELALAHFQEAIKLSSNPDFKKNMEINIQKLL